MIWRAFYIAAFTLTRYNCYSGIQSYLLPSPVWMAAPKRSYEATFLKLFSACNSLFASAIVALLALVPAATAQTATHVVISQVYGGGGGTSATTTYSYNTDYVELYNPTSSAISLSGLSIQYASTTGNFGSVTTNVKALTGTIQPGKYYLVSGAPGTVGGTLPTADETGSFSLSATAGKVALVNGTAALGTSTPCISSSIVDEVSYGTGTSCAEGTAAPAPSNTTSVTRNSSGVDTNNNAADFSAITPVPHNSGTAVVAPVMVTPIATLQGNRSTYVGTKVATTGVVTTLLYNGFFIQTPSSTPGSTGVAEGINIYTGSAPTAHVGDNVTVTGSLQLFPAATASVTPALEITSPAVTTNSTGNPLPTPIALTTVNLTPGGGLQQLTKYEGMRVSFASLTSISGTGGGSLDEVNEIYKSTGQFYATITGTPRPFREPGIDVRDAAAATAPSTVPRFDDNPERILVDTYVGLNTTPLDVSTGATFKNLTGVLDFTYSNDSFYDPSRFIPDVATLSAGYTPGITVQALPLPAAGQFTVGAYNIERFFNTNSADNLDFYPVTGQVETSEAVTVTAAAYARRLAKVSLAIRHVLNNPEILALEEEENGFVLKDIAAQISADAITAGEPDPKYVAYGTDNATFYSNDESGISTGFLVKSTVDFIALNQFFNKTVFTPSGGSPTTTDDRPPFVLHAGIKRGAGIKDYPITVIVNHMKALPDTTTAVQQKKELQAEELAGLIQGYQANGEHVLAVGDFNFFEFSDGYIDELGTVTNRTVPANTVILPGKPGLVTPSPTDLVLNLPAAQRYSYVEDGNAQVLDHIVATADLVPTTTLAYGHLDADFPLTAYNDATTPARVSDHDPALAYLALPAPVTSATFTGNGTFPTTIVGNSSAGQVFAITNTGETPVTVSIATTGDFAQSNNCTISLPVGTSCSINVVFTPTAAGTRTGTITVTSNATVAPIALTGTAVPPPSFTVADNGTGAATTNITVVAGTNATGTLKFTSTGGFAGAITVTCAPQGTAATGLTCAATSPVTLAAAGTATSTITITTTAHTTVSGFGSLPRSGRMLYTLLIVLLAGAAYMLRRAGRNARIGSLFVLLFAAALGISGCGSSSHLNTSANPNGTPIGTYNYTVTATTATSGTITKTQTLAITVQ